MFRGRFEGFFKYFFINLFLIAALSSCTNYEKGIIFLSPEVMGEVVGEFPPAPKDSQLIFKAGPEMEPMDETSIPIARVIEITKGPFETIEEKEINKSVLINNSPLSAAVSLHDYRFSIDIEEVKNYFLGNQKLPEGVVILPISEITPPLRAIPIRSDEELLYLDSDSYPLSEKVYLKFEIIPPEEQRFWKEKQYLKRYNSFLDSYLERIDTFKEQKAREVHHREEGKRLVWITSVGDMMFERGVAPALSGEGGLERVFQDTLPILRGSDISVGNLEGTISSGRKAIPKSYHFSFPKSILDPLKRSGFEYLMITNNHIWDYGEEGFLDTLNALEEAGIPSSGAGRDLSEASRPWHVEIHGQKIAILSVGAFPRERNGFDGKKEAAAGEERSGILFTEKGAEHAIREAFSDRESFHILYVHGGWEWRSAPDTFYEKLYRSFVDAGADLVVGSHPHVLQRMEAYKGALIAYSLGNFIFPGMEGIRGAESSLLLRTAIFEGRILYVEPVPATLDGISVHLDKDEGALAAFLDLP